MKKIAKKAKPDAAALNKVATDYTVAQFVATIMVTQGALILQNEFGMSVEDSARWANLTLAAARAELQRGDNDGKQTG